MPIEMVIVVTINVLVIAVGYYAMRLWEMLW